MVKKIPLIIFLLGMLQNYASAQFSVFSTFKIEAESATNSYPGTADTWTNITEAAAFGNTAVFVGPDDGDNFNNVGNCCGAGVSNAAHLEFNVNLPTSGTWTVLVRVRDGGGNSYHIGANGAIKATVNGGIGANYTWIATQITGLVAGANIIDIWEREDGLIIDQIVISNDFTCNVCLLYTSPSPRDRG